MKALRHISGILFAAIGVMFFIGAVGDMINPESEMPLWMDIMLLTVLGLLPLGGAVVLLKRKEADRTATCCPRCGNAEQAPAGVLVSVHGSLGQ